MIMSIDFEVLARTASDAIVVVEADGNIVFWNAAATRIFGFEEAEAMGKSLDIIVPPGLRQRHWEGFDKVMQSGVTRYGADLLRVPASHKDARRLSIGFTVSLLAGPDGKPAAIVAFMRDETRRWEQERAQAKRLAELEAQPTADAAPTTHSSNAITRDDRGRSGG